MTAGMLGPSLACITTQTHKQRQTHCTNYPAALCTPMNTHRHTDTHAQTHKDKSTQTHTSAAALATFSCAAQILPAHARRHAQARARGVQASPTRVSKCGRFGPPLCVVLCGVNAAAVGCSGGTAAGTVRRWQRWQMRLALTGLTGAAARSHPQPW